MAATQSRLSQYTNLTPDVKHGGGFDTPDNPHDELHVLDEPYVAIYPGPAASLEQYQELTNNKPALVPVSEFRSWSRTAAFPQVPTIPAFRVWRKMKQQHRFDGSDINARALSPPPPARSHMSEQSHKTGYGTRSVSKTQGLEVQTSTGRFQCNHGSAPIPPRRRAWRFRGVAELHATHDRKQFINDDGDSAQHANSTPPMTEKGS